MGLDMYLYATKCFYASKWINEEETEKTNKIYEFFGGSKFLDEDRLNIAEVKIQIAYWRKANAIHKYFVDNCAGGKDECQPIYVEREQLEKLLNLCKTVLEDHSKAEELLPSQSGFFFGSTDYDEFYFSDLENTATTLEEILKDAPEDWEFEYQASW